MGFTFYRQHDGMDCGPTCLRMIAKKYGRTYPTQYLRDLCGINREGTALIGISDAAEKIGFRTRGAKLTLQQLEKVTHPCILYWNRNHFVVLYKISKSTFGLSKNIKYCIADPAHGLMEFNQNDFKRYWLNHYQEDINYGVTLLLEVTPAFYETKEDVTEPSNFRQIFRYLSNYKKLILQLFIGLGAGTLLQLVFPFLTQSMVDVGIGSSNIQFVYLILLAQSMLFFGKLSLEFLRSWILLHISTRINLSILTDFLIKLMSLPMGYFDTRMTGDIMQRMNDHRRIEAFLTGSTLNVIFSVFNFLVFSVVLAYYNLTIFLIFLSGSIIYSIWIVFFLKRRRTLDYLRFNLSSQNQSSIMQLINGMQDIKLNNCEKEKRWEWESIQAGLLKFNVKLMSLNQIQQTGAFFINEGKNIIITFLVVKLVIDGHLSLGAMMAIQYIIGQLNSPVEQFLSFVQQMQEARISLERLNEIKDMEEEEPASQFFFHELPVKKDIYLENLTFHYPGSEQEPVLKSLNLHIPEGRTTAIVGFSGSGKTTLLKLLLRFYTPQRGKIKIDQTDLGLISPGFWRSNCGIVMQEGFIFSDTILNNIIISDPKPDLNKVFSALDQANIREFVEQLPQGLYTKIGAEGNGISQGQKQRILIARAIYKDPQYILLDEATNALDAKNEKEVIGNLASTFKGRTVVVIAHRLSTIKHADNIVVLEKGAIVEHGNHMELMSTKGIYYNLVQNQLEADLTLT